MTYLHQATSLKTTRTGANGLRI